MLRDGRPCPSEKVGQCWYGDEGKFAFSTVHDVRGDPVRHVITRWDGCETWLPHRVNPSAIAWKLSAGMLALDEFDWHD